MSYNFFIIGGDMRMLYLANELSKEGNEVKIMGFEKNGYEDILNNNIKIAHSINEVEQNDTIISSIPLTMDNINVYAPYSINKIPLKILEGKKIIAGKIPKNIIGYDILKDETIAIYNSIPTAEGAIALAINETDITLDNNNVLVLGFGRVGKILCNKLKAMNCNVFCMARKEKDLAWIKAYGYNAISMDELNDNLCKMKVIFNTVPEVIIDKTRLILLKNETIIIDLASGSGGIDFESAKKLKIKTIQYLGIPGKIASKTVAKYLKDSIIKLKQD